MKTTRRQFIRGAVAVAVSAALPRIPGDGVVLQSIAHPKYYDPSMKMNKLVMPEEMARKMARALVHSMMQTHEITARNVLNMAFGGERDEEQKRVS